VQLYLIYVLAWASLVNVLYIEPAVRRLSFIVSLDWEEVCLFLHCKHNVDSRLLLYFIKLLLSDLIWW